MSHASANTTDPPNAPPVPGREPIVPNKKRGEADRIIKIVAGFACYGCAMIEQKAWSSKSELQTGEWDSRKQHDKYCATWLSRRLLASQRAKRGKP